MKNIFFISLIFALILGCKPKKDVIVEPDGLISEEKMIDVLSDVHLIEGSRTGLFVMGDSIDIGVYYNHLFTKYDITAIEYDESFNYYLKDPDRMDAMYEKVIEKLSMLEEADPKKD